MMLFLEVIYYGLMVYPLYCVVDTFIFIFRLIKSTVRVFKKIKEVQVPDNINDMQDYQIMLYRNLCEEMPEYLDTPEFMEKEHIEQEGLDNPAPIFTFPRLAFWAGVAVWFHYFFYAV